MIGWQPLSEKESKAYGHAVDKSLTDIIEDEVLDLDKFSESLVTNAAMVAHSTSRAANKHELREEPEGMHTAAFEAESAHRVKAESKDKHVDKSETRSVGKHAAKSEADRKHK